ncbi:hypothetical protein LIER_23144 [Lithospermum erythrorhizon]|uniref:Uncharacterized protein n=1 Tax=Lithospermum erythrorhizon TaxID=34254 RepID=A0AAV3QZK5_LITER
MATTYYEDIPRGVHIEHQERPAYEEGELYKLSNLGPLMYCVPEAKIQQTLNEVHDGDCGHHIGGRALPPK